MKAKSIQGSTPKEIRKAFQDCISEDFKPTLAFVFIPFKTEIKPYSEELEKNEIAIFGISTFGNWYEDPITQSPVSILLLDLNPDYFKIIYKEHYSESPELVATTLAKEIAGDYKNPNILLYAAEFKLNFSNILKSFTDVFGMDVNLYGALSGCDESLTEGLVFTNRKKGTKAFVALVFDSDRIEMKGDIFSGWNSVGTVKTVTKSKGNEILEIDGKPVVDITMRYSGIKDLPEDLFEATMVVSRTMSMNFQREKSEPVTLMGIVTENRTLVTHANCPVGSRVQFALPPEFEVIEETTKRFNRLKEDMPGAEAVILYSCANRLDVLGPFVEDEVKAVRALWDVPLAGFMSNGEIGRSRNGDLEIHNCTQICVVLEEK